MRVSITGSEGFIGRYVKNALIERGHLVYGIDRALGIDIQDEVARKIVESSDAVIHLAGMLGTDDLFEMPEEAIDVNVKGTLNVLKGCEKYHTHFVGITMPEVWDNVYQATKTCARNLASAWHRHYDVPVSHVRAYNVFGPGQKVGHPQKIIPTFANAAWNGAPIRIWGTGDQVVDLVYVRDVATMMVDALRFGDNRVFDCGTGQSFSVNSVAAMVMTATRNTVPVEHLPMRKGEHGLGVVANGENLDLLGWRPEFRMADFMKTIESYRPRH